MCYVSVLVTDAAVVEESVGAAFMILVDLRRGGVMPPVVGLKRDNHNYIRQWKMKCNYARGFVVL